MLRQFIFVLLISSLLWSAYWTDPTANHRVCFDANSSHAVQGNTDHTEWSVYDLALAKNGTFWDNNLYNSEFSIFVYAENSSHVFVMLPAINDTQNQSYCIYSNSTSDSQSVYVGYITFDDSQENWAKYGPVAWTVNENIEAKNDHVTDHGAVYHPSAEVEARGKAKIKVNDVHGYNDYAGLQIDGTYTAYTDSSLIITGTENWTIKDQFVYNESGFPTPWRIAQLTITNETQNGTLFDINMTILGSNSSAESNTDADEHSFPLKDSNISVDWYVGSWVDNDTQYYYASNVLFEEQSDNITINSPTPGGSYTEGEITSIVYSLGVSFDNCTIYLNDVVQETDTSPDSTNTVTIDEADIVNGNNYIQVTCLDNVSTQSRYSSFSYVSQTALELFSYAFDADISGCDGDVLNNLSNTCIEWYRTEDAYNFSAVVCENLPTNDYSCLASIAANTSKGSYTFFTNIRNDKNWTYPQVGGTTLDLPHIGANFYYNSIAITNGMEIISNESFIYIPAQTKLRDCGVYYSSTSHCSLWSGFILNDRTVYISNNRNEWFAAGGYGVTAFNTNHSDMTVNVNVVPIGQFILNQTYLEEQGIFTRLSCYSQNSTYYMKTRNTIPVTYYLVVEGTSAHTYTTSSTVFDYNIPIYNDTIATLYSNGREICYYGTDTRFFMPFALGDLSTTFSEVFIKILFVFAAVVSALIPYSVIIMVILNDLFGVISMEYMSMLVVFACIASLVNTAYHQSRGIKNIIVMMAILVGFLTALGQSMEANSLPDSTGFIDLFTSFKSIAEAQGIAEMVAGLFTFSIQLFVTIVFLPVVLVGYLFDLVIFINPTLGTALAPFSIIAVGAVVYLYIKAYEVLGNKFRDV